MKSKAKRGKRGVSRYSKGYKAELCVKEILEREGNLVFRIARSKPFDLVVLGRSASGRTLSPWVCEVKKWRDYERRLYAIVKELVCGREKYGELYHLVLRTRDRWCILSSADSKVWCRPLESESLKEFCACEFIRRVAERYRQYFGQKVGEEGGKEDGE